MRARRLVGQGPTSGGRQLTGLLDVLEELDGAAFMITLELDLTPRERMRRLNFFLTRGARGSSQMILSWQRVDHHLCSSSILSSDGVIGGSFS